MHHNIVLMAVAVLLLAASVHSTYREPLPAPELTWWIPREEDRVGYWLLNSKHFIDLIYSFMYYPHSSTWVRLGCGLTGRCFGRVEIRKQHVPFEITFDVMQKLKTNNDNAAINPFSIKFKTRNTTLAPCLAMDCSPSSKHTHFPKFMSNLKRPHKSFWLLNPSSVGCPEDAYVYWPESNDYRLLVNKRTGKSQKENILQRQRIVHGRHLRALPSRARRQPLRSPDARPEERCEAASDVQSRQKWQRRVDSESVR